MMRDVVVTERAKEDLAEIHAHLLTRSEQAAGELVERIVAGFTRLAANPLVGRRRLEFARRGIPVRSWRIATYLIIYRVRRNVVEIIRVVSGYRDLPRLLGR